MGKYDDIMKLEPVAGKNRKKMDLNDRAKIFLPFAALTGYEEIIAANSRILDKRRELLDEAKAEIDRCIKIIDENIKDHPFITVTYFKEEQDSSDGHYMTISGYAEILNLLERNITIDSITIYLDDIYEFKGTIFEHDEPIENI